MARKKKHYNRASTKFSLGYNIYISTFPLLEGSATRLVLSSVEETYDCTGKRDRLKVEERRWGAPRDNNAKCPLLSSPSPSPSFSLRHLALVDRWPAVHFTSLTELFFFEENVTRETARWARKKERDRRRGGGRERRENYSPPMLRVLHRVFRLEPFLPISRSRPRHYLSSALVLHRHEISLSAGPSVEPPRLVPPLRQERERSTGRDRHRPRIPSIRGTTSSVASR